MLGSLAAFPLETNVICPVFARTTSTFPEARFVFAAQEGLLHRRSVREGAHRVPAALPYLESNWQAVGSADNEQETALGLGNCAFVIDGIFDVDEMTQANPSVKLGQFLVPSPDGQKAKVDWYPDANFSMNSKISDPAEKKAAEKIIQFTTTKTFGNIWDKVTGTVSPISGVTIPKSNALASEAAAWYDKTPISSLWGIRSDMDTPAPDPATLKSKQVASSIKGIFEAEQNIAVPLLEHKLTPKQAAAQVQKAQQWYFQGSN